MPLIWGFYSVLFLFDLDLGASAEIPIKILLVFLGNLKTPKVHFKINWSLRIGKAYFTINQIYHVHFKIKACEVEATQIWVCKL